MALSLLFSAEIRVYRNIDFLVDINNWCYNQELCNENRELSSYAVCNLVALSMLDKLP